MRKTYVVGAICGVVAHAAQVFEVLADPTRRRLVEAMRAGERSVNELVEEMDIGQPGVSRQLGILHDAGFVRMRPDGRRRLYSLRPEPFRELEKWVRSYERALEESYSRLDAHLERMKKEMRG
jgi:DNA-binding transcriptional ArsR family regulator